MTKLPGNEVLNGVWCPSLMPLDAKLEPDVGKFIDHCRWVLEEGCHGLVMFGTTGEANSFSVEERIRVLDAAIDAGLPADRMMVGTGCAALPDTVHLTRHAIDRGALGILMLPPFYYKNPSDEGLYAYFAHLVETIARDDLRVYLYHFPQMSATPLSSALVTRLRNAFGAVIAGLKDSSGDFEQSRAIVAATGGVAEDFDVYPSSEAMLWDGLAIGTAGIISGSTNAFGAKAQAALQASEGPARDAAMEAVREARSMAGGYPLMAMMKTIEAWRSGDEAWLRMAPPLVPLTAEQKVKLRSDFDALEETIAAE